MKMGRKRKLTDHEHKERSSGATGGDETLAKIGRFYNVRGWTAASTVSHVDVAQNACLEFQVI